ncbi:DUF2523 family protein [Pseudomonas sp. EA_65y_Pfl2_P78]|uniref:DUF2523 family protein n=1 Tax=Pseudomonas sp. EA_65y_Pfl2_P78 TaxID=3088695 RepID=UPI00403F988B
MSAFGEWLLSIIRELLQFIIDIPIEIITWIWESFLKLISTSWLMGLIQSAGDVFTTIPSSVWYFMNMMQIPYGISVVTSAYFLRFLVRRIPFIG